MPTHIKIKNVETLKICHDSVSANELDKLEVNSLPQAQGSEISGSQVAIEASYNRPVSDDEKKILGVDPSSNMKIGRRILLPLTESDDMTKHVRRSKNIFEEIADGMKVKLMYSSTNNVLVCLKDEESGDHPLLNLLQYDTTQTLAVNDSSSRSEVAMFDFGAEQPKLSELTIWMEADSEVRFSYPVKHIAWVDTLEDVKRSYPSIIFAVVEDQSGDTSLIQVIADPSVGPPGSNRRAFCASTQTSQNEFIQYLRALSGCHRR